MKSNVEKILNKYCFHHSSLHYDFYFSENSLANKDIIKIADTQESCYNKISSALNIIPNFKIKYMLADTPQDLGILYGDYESCNGFTKLPNNIYAVYNEQIKCIGMHEDAHIISYSVKNPTLLL